MGQSLKAGLTDTLSLHCMEVLQSISKQCDIAYTVVREVTGETTQWQNWTFNKTAQLLL